MATHSKSKYGSATVVVALLLVPVAWVLLHRILGGAELPPPKWTEADVVPLPLGVENAWYVIGPMDQMPELTIDSALWDDSVPIPKRDRAAVEAELARPEVRALMATVPAVLDRPHLVPPQTLDFAPIDLFRLQQWRLWVGLSLNSTVEQDPGAAAQLLSKLFPMWIECANSARSAIDYMVCANGAKRDLDLMLRAAEMLLQKRHAHNLELLRAAVRDTPAISPDNVMTVDYVLEYRKLASLVSELDGFQIDFKSTLDLLNSFFEPEHAEELCASQTDSGRLPIYEYNRNGKRAAKAVAAFHCVGRPHMMKATKAVADRRAALLERLKEAS